MPKKGRHPRGGRTTPKGTRPPGTRPLGDRGPTSTAGFRAPPVEPDPFEEIRFALQYDDVLALVTYASSLVAATDPRSADPFSSVPHPSEGALQELVTAFIDDDRPETTALLTMLGYLGGDDVTRTRALNEADRRTSNMPEWLTRFGDTTVGKIIEVHHVLGDGDNLLIDVAIPGTDGITFVAYIDHNAGTALKDGFFIPAPIDDAVDMMLSVNDDPDMTWLEIDHADARARIEGAITVGAMTVPRFESDTWPMARPLLEWLISKLPSGGVVPIQHEWTEDERAELKASFFASLVGTAFDTDEGSDLLEIILWFGCDYPPGDPLRWSTVAVERFLTDFVPRKVMAEPLMLASLPALLEAFVEYSHEVREISESLTDDTVDAIHEWTPHFLAAIGFTESTAPRTTGSASHTKSPRPNDSDEASVHQLKVSLKHMKPPVWRRLEVPSTSTLKDLHGILQTAFDWENEHLHEFEIGSRRFGNPGFIDDFHTGFGTPVEDETSVCLADVASTGTKFTYTYDFGDNWIHQIVVEDVTARSPMVAYPRCMAGRCAAPPEDSGDFDPPAFNRDQLNLRLQH